ncbi:hypothetical protein BDW02DRAFT_464173, partial [Decorospora gaudefroyi]
NVTLQFLQNNQDSCSIYNSTDALTFTTSSTPITPHCFEVSELFAGNTSAGFVNQSHNLGGMTLADGRDPGIHWQLKNKDSYDPQGNYTTILYRQHIAYPDSDDQEPGHFAIRRVTIYGGHGCTELDPNDDDKLLDWYGFSCWSEDEGTCGYTGYNIRSFSVQPLEEEDRNGDVCWVFAQLGGAPRAGSSAAHAMVGAFVTVALAV